MIMCMKQKRIKFKPSIKLNHNISNVGEFSERGNTCSITLKNSPDHLVYPQKFGVYNHALSSISLGSTGMPRRN